MKKVIGAGVILLTPVKTLLLQERDNKAVLYPGKIAVFGGGIEGLESTRECAMREMYEELNLRVNAEEFEGLGLFESLHRPGVFNEIFALRGIDMSRLNLREGRSIVEISKEEALVHPDVTDYTKSVITKFYI